MLQAYAEGYVILHASKDFGRSLHHIVAVWSRGSVITLSHLTRFRSRKSDCFGARVIAALRNEFGGHAVKTT